MPSAPLTVALATILALSFADSGIAQSEEISPPAQAEAENKADTPSVPDALTEDEKRAKLEAIKLELLALEKSAEKGDLEAALELANQLIAYRNATVALPFYRQAAQGGVTEAQEKLGLLLLNSGNEANWSEGHSWLDRATEKNSVRALEEQARVLLQGSHGRERAPDKARVLLERACTLPGARESHFLLGKMAAEGIGRERDGVVAVAHLRKGEQAGSLDAMLGLIELFGSEVLVKKDLAEAERLARKAYDLGSGEAAYRMAVILEQETTANPTEAREWLEKARSAGHGGASARLGTYALEGRGEERDSRKAYQLYREAAARGHSDAALGVAKLYDAGEGVPADPVAAAGWYRVAAESGQVQAQNEYGVRLVSGRGVTADPAAAAEWFRRAGQQNLPSALVNLGELHLAGNGVETNHLKAHSLFEQAARGGHAGGQERLARMCQKGLGLPADPIAAAYWAARAAEQNEKLKDFAAQLRGELDEAQLKELDQQLGQ